MSALVQAIAQALTAAGLAVTAKFPSSRAARLRQPVVAVSLQALQGEGSGFADYLGLTEDGRERYGKRVRATLLCRIAAPSGESAATAAETVMAALLAGVSGVQIRKLTVSETSFDAVADCFTLDVTAEAAVWLYAEQTGDDPLFLDFRLECEPK